MRPVYRGRGRHFQDERIALPPSGAPTILFEAMRAGRLCLLTIAAFIAARGNAG
jgi:hypothetical protein